MQDVVRCETGNIENGVTLGTNLKIKARKLLIRKNCTMGNSKKLLKSVLMLQLTLEPAGTLLEWCIWLRV